MTDDLAEPCFRALLSANATVATAESLTGGLLGAALTARPGSSATYRGGVVAYSLDLKAALLDVPEELLAEHGPVHPDTAAAMARGARERLGATYGLATTGVAGPEPHGDQPVGTVEIACALPTGTAARRELFSGDREEIRAATVHAALELLLESIKGAPGGRSRGD